MPRCYQYALALIATAVPSNHKSLRLPLRAGGQETGEGLGRTPLKGPSRRHWDAPAAPHRFSPRLKVARRVDFFPALNRVRCDLGEDQQEMSFANMSYPDCFGENNRFNIC